MLSANAVRAQGAKPAPAAAPSAFEQSSEWGKLDDATQQAWKSAMATDPTQRLDCFVRVNDNSIGSDQSFLLSHGFVVRQFAGSIATGHMQAGAMQDVAKLPFVASIRISSRSK